MTLVFFGTGSFGLTALEALASAKHSIQAVVTSPDKPKGRRLRENPSDIKKWAMAYKIPVIQFGKGDEPRVQEELRRLETEVFVVISFGVLLTEELLRLPRLGAFNVHASLLPRYRGASPIRSAILDGENRTGVTVMRMTARLDAGDILLQEAAEIDASDDAVTLEKKLSTLAGEALLESLKRLQEGTAHFVTQDEASATYAPKIRKEDGLIDWTYGTHSILNRIRAMVGWPGAFAIHQGKRLALLAARKADLPRKPEAPGQVLLGPERNFFLASASDGWVELTRVQLESKKPLEASDFLRGYSIKTGDFLE